MPALGTQRQIFSVLSQGYRGWEGEPKNPTFLNPPDQRCQPGAGTGGLCREGVCEEHSLCKGLGWEGASGGATETWH